ncbi:hypothetical protein [Mucilaginibacter myungsuensis]|uniref:Nucleotide-binding universal stress UspA family protein n=1 Tax=Mucilaginibacter myungsuensis TaxID=649104 RepID=A0A929KS27_9SPHI|nr:hypothetical protein [Mucilaginibacter myungsuensis]MBE9660461.1 hypothetical protein [Mucilaginibacter myungsuensis]MDN3600503.1 hypothetical protein [Mucilaginibacter myungsuensis]
MKTKNILVPTDFSLASLTAINNLLHKHPDQKFNISMVHFMQVSDSITELLMLSRRASEYQHITQEFEDQLGNLKRLKKDQLVNVSYEFFYGSTVAVFKNFLEAKDIESVVSVKDHTYNKLNRYSVDPELLIQKCKYPVIEVSAVMVPVVTVAARVAAPQVEELEEV